MTMAKTKQEKCNELVAAGVLPSCYDFALPQDWLDQFERADYAKAAEDHVWAYPQGLIFGMPLNITTMYETLKGVQIA